MKSRLVRGLAVSLALILVAVVQRPSALSNGGSITALGVPLTENFDALAATGTNVAWTDTTTIPGWYSTRDLYNSGTGSSNAGALYSFGVAGTNPATDRALGSVASGTTTTVFQAARLTNNTGGTITSLDISYTGEQWRNGGNATAHSLTFQYQVANAGVITDANAPTTGWTTFSPLSFTGPVATATAATLDGNAAPNRTAKSATLTVTVGAGQEIWLRWQDPDDAGSDHGLAIDDFSVTANGSPGDNAPTVAGTTPAHAASSVAVDSNIVINFGETVNATAAAFAFQCPAGSPPAFAQSASPSSAFTLTPASNLPYSTVCTVTVSANEITDADADDPPDQMASDFTFSFTTASPGLPVATNVLINEVDADTPGADAAEFVELFDGGVGNTALDGLVVVFFNGSSDLSYSAFDLDGFSTDANGYFTLGNAPGSDLVFGSNFLQNGADAVALYAGDASGFPTNTAVTTTNLRDAIVYGTDDADDPGLLALLNAGQPQANESDAQSSQRCPNGSGGARNTSTYSQGTPSPDGPNTCAPPVTPSNSVIVISQVYGSGGNAGATYHNDYVELYNRGTTAVDIGGWSLQYASATGSGWDFGKQPLGGTIGPGQYYLIALASGGADGGGLPPAQINGQINISGTSGKLALVNSFDGLAGNCPIADPHVMDLVGYGSADCREGTATAPAPGNTTAIFRVGGGTIDTDRNGSDFVAGSPAPRQTAPIVELGPLVLSSDPRTNGASAPRDATIAVTFTEPVDVAGSWVDITCAGSGPHNSATFAGGGQTHHVTPNANFLPGEQCTVTIFKGQISDQDLDDSGPDTDTLPANYVWSFTVATGTAPPYPPSVHLTMGNPTGAAASIGQPNNYLMEKPEFVLSYSRDLGRPNWVSWHLSDEWIGSLTRVDTFRPDPAVPSDWYRVQAFDFTNSGFDRGHMVPNADRDKETSIPINQATFLMSNMVAQAPDNNQGPWASFENHLRTLTPAEEVYIVAGGVGAGGSGSNGGVTMTLADGHVTVPAYTWKAVLVIPKDNGDDISRVSCSSRTIAVIMPNTQGIRNDPWENFLTNVDAVETLTGYDLFTSLPEPIQRCVEAGTNGNNPPLVKGDQTITFAAPVDGTYGVPPFTVSAIGGPSGNPVTFTASGACTSGGANGATMTIVSAGSCAITASQAGSDLYNAASASVTMAVAKAAPAFSAIAAPVIEAGTTSVTLSGQIALGSLVPTGVVSITLNGVTFGAPITPDGTFTATVGSTSLGPGVHVTGFSYGGDGNFTGAAAAGTVTVTDTTAPVIAGLRTTQDLFKVLGWRFVNATVHYQATDAGGQPVCTLAVSPVGAVNHKDGLTWHVVGAHHVLFAWHGGDDGRARQFDATVSCADGAGNRSSAVSRFTLITRDRDRR